MAAKSKTSEETVSGLAGRIDNFERYTEPHSRAMAYLAVRLARRFGLTQSDANAIAEAALLHDVGLLAMSPDYHSAPGPLSFEQRVDLWRHPIIGEQQLGKRGTPRLTQLLVRWHHEWWNGAGYPDALAFEDIPIGARILRAVELFSAISSERPYRAALAPEEVLEALKSSAAIECDPYVVKALLALLEELREAFEAEPSPDVAIFTKPEPAPAAELEDPSSAVEPQAPEPADEASTPSLLPSIRMIVSRARARESGEDDPRGWNGWRSSSYNRKVILGFEASVLRQLNFRSIAVAFSGGSRIDWYLSAWRKLVLSNDPRAWATVQSRATVEAKETLSEDHIAKLMHDIYVPGVTLANPGLRRWFGESDAWWMDNLRRNAGEIEDESLRAQAMALGIQTGDYALSFGEETRELKRPLTAVFWRLAGQALTLPLGHPHSRAFNLPAEEFIRSSHAEALYLCLPSAHSEDTGSAARSQWRESWVRGSESEQGGDLLGFTGDFQSKHAYLDAVDRLLGLAGHMKTWAVGCQDVGIASARDISDLIKTRRPVRATYSKDLSEVAGGLRSYIMIAE